MNTFTSKYLYCSSLQAVKSGSWFPRKVAVEYHYRTGMLPRIGNKLEKSLTSSCDVTCDISSSHVPHSSDN